MTAVLLAFGSGFLFGGILAVLAVSYKLDEQKRAAARRPSAR